MDQQLTSQYLGDAELTHRALSAGTGRERAAAFEAIADRYRLEVLRRCAGWFPDPEAAQDVGQTTFEAAFSLLARGNGPARPDKLGGWLIEIAKRRRQEYQRRASPAGVTWAILPEDRSLDDLADDAESRSGSAVRQAHATRLVDAVVATLTERQQQMYQLRFVQELTGRQAAERLGITDKAASNEATIVQNLIADGFGALILFQEGRAYCADLAQIIDSTVGAAAGTGAFSAALRERITHHFGTCKTCDDCRTCNDKRRELVGPYVPGLIPILFAARFRERITEIAGRIATQAGHHPPSHPGSGPHPGRRNGTRLRRELRRRPVASAGIVVLALAAAGTGVVILASSGGGVAATHAAVSPEPGVITVNDTGQRLPAQVLAIASEVLTDARNHDSAALGRLLDPTDPTSAKVVAQNKILASPGVYAQIITLLTKTHGASQDGFTGWPGFLLAGTGAPLDAADAKTLGVTSSQDYRGIVINIGAAYTENPYVPKFAGITQIGPGASPGAAGGGG